MEEQGDVFGGLSSISRSDPKDVGERRSSDELVKRRDYCRKILRLEPNLGSETTTVCSEDVDDSISKKKMLRRSLEMSQIAQAKDENTMQGSMGQFDLNSDTDIVHDSALSGSEEQFLLERDDSSFETQKGIGLDLNADAISSSAHDDLSVCSSRVRGATKSRDVFSECGSSNTPREEKDSMKIWKAMKQNGFLSNPHGGISGASSCIVSSSHGGIPNPRKRGRKSKSDVMKRKIEIARKEEVDRFAKLAAPCGLLNELNPGIINHVRNKKQVLSLIKNLVKTEKDSANLHGSSNRQSGIAIGGSKNLDDVNADGSISDLNQTDRWFMPLDKYPLRNQEEKCWDGGFTMVDTISGEHNTLGLNTQSTAKFPDNTTSSPSQDSSDISCANVLTVKAATVASQWLELLHQDMKGRLLALRRSRKRVRAVITTELPFLILKEFPSRADIHRARWTALFNQMELTLSEEEKQLESWLIQVKELQSHCDQGLQHLSMSSGHNFLQLGMPLDSRAADALSSEKELAVRAAAASIYSTCNFLSSKENITYN